MLVICNPASAGGSFLSFVAYLAGIVSRAVNKAVQLKLSCLLQIQHLLPSEPWHKGFHFQSAIRTVLQSRIKLGQVLLNPATSRAETHWIRRIENPRATQQTDI